MQCRPARGVFAGCAPSPCVRPAGAHILHASCERHRHGGGMHLLPRRIVVSIAMLTLATATPAWSVATSGVTLEWTAPGDDDRFGRAQAYVLRYSTEPITDGNFGQAAIV